MSREKQEQDSQDLKDRIAKLEADLKEKEARLAEGEEGAMKRVCAALDIDVKDVAPKDVKKKEPEMIVECFVNTPVRINQTIYQGLVKVPHSVFCVLSQAMGDRRMRILRELTGNNYLIQELAGGGRVAKVVGTVGLNGERVG